MVPAVKVNFYDADELKVRTRISSFPQEEVVFPEVHVLFFFTVGGVVDSKQALLGHLWPHEAGAHQDFALGPPQSHRPGHGHHVCHGHCRTLGRVPQVPR